MPDHNHGQTSTSPGLSAYTRLGERQFASTPYTRGPWNAQHQHAGPPIALVCGAIEKLASEAGLTHIARLTANLLRPVPLADLAVEVTADYLGKNAGHYSARLLELASGKELARFTALAQRETPQPLPAGLAGHPLPRAPRTPQNSDAAQVPFADGKPGYAELVEIREAAGKNFQGPSAIWFRLNLPLVAGEAPSPYQRVAVAADSGNGISAVLDYRRDVFVNFDLSINLLRRPVGEWVCVDAKTWLGPQGGGLAESSLYDEEGLIGRATQSLSIRVAAGR